MKYKKKRNAQVNIQVGIPTLAVIGDSTPTSTRKGTSLQYKTIEKQDESTNATCQTQPDSTPMKVKPPVFRKRRFRSNLLEELSSTNLKDNFFATPTKNDTIIKFEDQQQLKSAIKIQNLLSYSQELQQIDDQVYEQFTQRRPQILIERTRSTNNSFIVNQQQMKWHEKQKIMSHNRYRNDSLRLEHKYNCDSNPAVRVRNEFKRIMQHYADKEKKKHLQQSLSKTRKAVNTSSSNWNFSLGSTIQHGPMKWFPY